MIGLPRPLHASAAILLALGLSGCGKDVEERLDRLDAEGRHRRYAAGAWRNSTGVPSGSST